MFLWSFPDENKFFVMFYFHSAIICLYLRHHALYGSGTHQCLKRWLRISCRYMEFRLYGCGNGDGQTSLSWGMSLAVLSSPFCYAVRRSHASFEFSFFHTAWCVRSFLSSGLLQRTPGHSRRAARTLQSIYQTLFRNRSRETSKCWWTSHRSFHSHVRSFYKRISKTLVGSFSHSPENPCGLLAC